MIVLSSAGESFLQLIVVLIIFVGVLALTTYVTKWIAGYQKTQGLNRNLEVVEAIRLTNNKFVEIVRAGENRYFVVACGKEEVTLLGEISGDELKEIDQSQIVTTPQIPVDFKSVLEKLSKKEK
jgi:flagellar protein FliO/FliZ